jgi:hypothetical protein
MKSTPLGTWWPDGCSRKLSPGLCGVRKTGCRLIVAPASGKWPRRGMAPPRGVVQFSKFGVAVFGDSA